jgi:uncharacterized protein YndB with AHSA1/START domain
MNTISVETVISAPIEKVWSCWVTPDDIQKWCFASDDWGVGEVVNDVSVGGKFSTMMNAKDGSAGFDFTGAYTQVEELKRIDYQIVDGRKVSVHFEELDGKVKVTEEFEMESVNTEEKQRAGWQSILNNFRHYVESRNI